MKCRKVAVGSKMGKAVDDYKFFNFSNLVESNQRKGSNRSKNQNP